MSASSALAAAARGVTALALLGFFVLGVPRGGSQANAWVVGNSTPPGTLAAALRSHAPGRIVYDDTVAPNRALAGLLAAGAAGGRSVTLRAPTTLPVLSVLAPDHPVAQRRSALTVTVRGEANQPLLLTIEDGVGQIDTVAVDAGPRGSTTVRIAVEPVREGVERWTVRLTTASAAGATTNVVATATAWVQPPAPLRVLVLSGAPGWETRYLVRSLEADGIDVEVREDLGRSLVVTSDGGAMPTVLDDLTPFDVVVASGTIATSATALLTRWVRDGGGGLLTLETGGGSGGTVEGGQSVPAGDLTWSGPAELIPLPSLALDVAGEPIAAPSSPGAVAVARVDGRGTFVTAATSGRGRVVRSALETWPWVLEGGAAGAHAAFWSSAVEWLAGGLTGDVLLTGPGVQPHVAWQGRLEGAVPTALHAVPGLDTTRDPNAGRAAERLTVARTGADRGLVRFVPTTAGAFTFAVDSASPFAATVVRPPDERLSWAEAALEVGGSGGSIVAANAVDASDGDPLDPGDGPAWLIFLALAGLMGAGWTVRRLRGLA